MAIKGLADPSQGGRTFRWPWRQPEPSRPRLERGTKALAGAPSDGLPPLRPHGSRTLGGNRTFTMGPDYDYGEGGFGSPPPEPEMFGQDWFDATPGWWKGDPYTMLTRHPFDATSPDGMYATSAGDYLKPSEFKSTA